MRATVLILGSLCVVAFCQAAEEQAPQPKQAGPQITKQEKRLVEIDEEMLRMSKRIEKSFERKVAELRRRAQEQIKAYEVAQRAELAKTAVKPGWFLATLGYIPQTGYTRDPNGSMLLDEQVALVESRIAEKKKNILQDLEQGTAALEKEKEYLLKASLPSLEKRIKDRAVQPAVQTRGVLNGIVYGKLKRSALVDREIVHEGDVIYGAKVIEIHRRRVVLRKNDKTWEQKVGEPAEAFWE